VEGDTYAWWHVGRISIPAIYYFLEKNNNLVLMLPA
jgi:hypothetical protein